MKKKHLLLLLGSLLLGGLIGMFGATFTNLHLNISQEQVQFILTTIFFCLGILSTIVALYFIMNSRKVYASYLAEEDDELNERAYIKMYRSLDYGTVAYNVLQVSMLFSLLTVLPSHDLPISAFLLAVLTILVGSFCIKTTSKIRNYQISILATPKEVLDYLETYDEGEKQAEMAEAYLILFKLNQLILPSVYIILFALSIILGQVQLVAALITAVIHLYINIAQLRKTKRYFK